eukprot:UC1_evm1s340
MNGNAVEAVVNGQFVPAHIPTNYVADSKSSSIISFELDLEARFMKLVFDETVSVASFNPRHLRIQSKADSSVESYTLTGGDRITQVNGIIVEFTLTVADIDQIKARRGMATEVSNGFVIPVADNVNRVTEHVILDASGNPVLNFDTGAVAAPMTKFTADSSSPSFLSFDLNLEAGSVTLYFNEAIAIETADFKEITIQSSQTPQGFAVAGSRFSVGESFVLTGGSFKSGSLADDLKSFTFDLSLEDKRMIKLNSQIAFDKSKTFLSMTTKTIKDVSNNAVIEVSAASAKEVSLFNLDSLSPVLNDFTLDMNNAERQAKLHLYFDDVVSISSFKIGSITIQNAEQNANV